MMTPPPASRPNCLKALNWANTSTKKAAAFVSAEVMAPLKVPRTASASASGAGCSRRSSQ